MGVENNSTIYQIQKTWYKTEKIKVSFNENAVVIQEISEGFFIDIKNFFNSFLSCLSFKTDISVNNTTDIDLSKTLQEHRLTAEDKKTYQKKAVDELVSSLIKKHFSAKEVTENLQQNLSKEISQISIKSIINELITVQDEELWEELEPKILDQLHTMLLAASDSDQRLYLDCIIKTNQNNKTNEISNTEILSYMLSVNPQIYNQEKAEALLNNIEKLSISEQMSIDIQRYKGYLNENKAKVFQRKIALHSNRTKRPKQTLLNQLFLDNEITDISKIEKSDLKPVQHKYVKEMVSEKGKTVLHQQAMKSCGQTCVAMLLTDLGFPSDLTLLFGGLTDEKSRMHVIEEQEPAVKEIQSELRNEDGNKFLTDLQTKITANGSAIVGVGGRVGNGRIGGHAIICDEISDDLQTVRIRDPWHGWEVTVTAKAFLDAVHESGEYFTLVQQLQKL